MRLTDNIERPAKRKAIDQFKSREKIVRSSFSVALEVHEILSRSMRDPHAGRSVVSSYTTAHLAKAHVIKRAVNTAPEPEAMIC